MSAPKGNPAKLEPAKAANLAKAVGYSKGGVVSRTLAGNKAGTITLFSFDAGQGLSTHSAPFDAFVLVVEGAVQLTIGGKKVTARAGEAVVMPANVPHAVKALGKFKMLLVMLKGR
jgi:quercetin dioxygenase-like cupin family protein